MNRLDRNPVSPELRQWCWHQMAARCWYCGEECGWGDEIGVIDHQLPRSRGGASSRENCVLACFNCNHDKSTSNLEQYRDLIKTRVVKQLASLKRYVRGTKYEGRFEGIDFSDFKFFGERG